MHSLAEAAARKLTTMGADPPTAEELAAYNALDPNQQWELRTRLQSEAQSAAAAAIQQNIANYGAPARRRFRGLSEDSQRALGIRTLIQTSHKVPASHGRHRRASGAAPIRTAGSRRTTATRAGPDDDSGDSDPDGEHHPLAARETAGVAG